MALTVEQTDVLRSVVWYAAGDVGLK